MKIYIPLREYRGTSAVTCQQEAISYNTLFLYFASDPSTILLFSYFCLFLYFSHLLSLLSLFYLSLMFHEGWHAVKPQHNNHLLTCSAQNGWNSLQRPLNPEQNKCAVLLSMPNPVLWGQVGKLNLDQQKLSLTIKSYFRPTNDTLCQWSDFISTDLRIFVNFCSVKIICI